MLILAINESAKNATSENNDETIIIGKGESKVELVVTRIAGKTARLGFKADSSIPINRKSVYESKFGKINH